MYSQAIVLALATLSTGIVAGIFFNWSNTVTTGIGRLNDLEYLNAFKAMNRTILNPAFFLAFFGPVLLLPVASYMQFTLSADYLFWMLVLVVILYLGGVIAVTIAGNIPLNDQLEASNIDGMTLEEAKTFRESFENRWNSLNWIRTFSSLGAFLILIYTCLITEGS